MTDISKEMKLAAEKQIREKEKEVNFDTKDYPIEVLVHKFRNGEFYIPEYQRKFIWDKERRVKFIESVLLGLPIPFMFFSDNEDGRCEIIDGAQRTQTLEAFLDNSLILDNLKKLNLLNGFKFEDLPETYKRKFNSKTLRIIVLDEETSLDTRQDIFNRINTSSDKAQPSEIRRGSYRGSFMTFIEECAKNKLFNKLCPISNTMRQRYEDSELVLRFFAYLNNYNEFNHRVDLFLDDFVEKNKDYFNEENFKDEFENMLAFVEKHFPFGFAKSKNAKSTPRVRFESISVGVALALRENPNLNPCNIDWINSKEFKEHTTTHSSNTKSRVVGRIEYVKDMLLKGEQYGSNF